MVMDEELLKKAQAAGSRLTEAERGVELARAEYHTAVRRLHLAGGSLREIAGALAMSHQRVQQIVNVAGGSWWQRVWRTRRVKRDTVCTFCDRPPSEVSKLVAGPNVYICDGCIELAERVLQGDARSGVIVLAKRGATARCSFCGRRNAAERQLATAPAAGVCSECLRLCRQILDDRRS